MSNLVTLPVLKLHLGGIQTKLDFNNVLPFIKLSENELKKQIGKDLFDYLKNLTPAAGSPEADLKYAAEGCVAWYAYDMAMPHLKIRVGDMGILKNSPNNTIAITKWEYVDTREANMAMVDLFLENFWTILELVKPIEWTGSEEFKKRQGLFIRSAAEMSRYAPVVNSNARFFSRLSLFIERAEREYLAGAVTFDVWNRLKLEWQNPSPITDPDDLSLIEHIRRALAYLALHEAYPYLPLIVDQEGLRQVRKQDGIREEDVAERAYRQAQRRQLWQDAQLYLAQLHNFLAEKAATTRYASYYTANVAPARCEDDFTSKSHVLL